MNKYLKVILTEMCNRVGVNYDKVNFKGKEWYMKHEWTMEDQDKFRDWLISYMKGNGDARRDLMSVSSSNKRFLTKFANSFLLNYGWRFTFTKEASG